MKKIDILEICKDAEKIGISGHVRPDGDCVGACMGLYLYLKKVYPAKQIQVLLEQPPVIFNCIKDLDQVQVLEPVATRLPDDFSVLEMEPEKPEVFDVFFCVDSVKDRIGNAEALFDHARVKVNIDHHISNAQGCGDLNYVIPEASSASELIFDLLDESHLDEDIAKAIYIGIIHDTGVFQYSNTSPKTLQIAAKLIAFGFDFPSLIDETFYEKTYVQNQMLGRALLESIVFMDGKCIVSGISKHVMEFYHATSKDMDGIVNQLRLTKGVECAIFMYETDTLTYKVSMRSGGKVDVAKVAQYFAGGGHVRAAGCTIRGTYHDVINNLSGHIAKQLEEQQ